MTRDASSDSEVTQRLDEVVAQVRRMEQRDRRRARQRSARQPMEWSAALVLMVFALCVLAGFVSYLYLVG